MDLVLLLLMFVALLWFEWRRRSRSIRVFTAVLAIALLGFSEPVPRRAARQVISLPPSERIRVFGGRPLSEYGSGVATMERAVVEDVAGYRDFRLLAAGVLLWLAVSPVFQAAGQRLISRKTPATALPPSAA